MMLSFLLHALALLGVVALVCGYECHIAYPTSLLQPVTGSYFSGTLTSEKLTCFGNREYLSASYLEALGCLVRGYSDCHGVWGSRSVLVESEGSMEVFRVARLPVESAGRAQPLNASRWIQLSGAEEGPPAPQQGGARTAAREAKQVAAEPIFFCARCNDWRDNSSAYFRAHFRQAYIRNKDKVACEKYVLLLVASMALLAALPALSKAVLVAAAAYAGFYYGLQRFIMIYTLCTLCTIVLPFMRGKRTRRFFRYYLRAILAKGQDQEANEVVRSSVKALDVLFSASLLLTAGTAVVYALFYYDCILREARNTLIKILIAAAAAWIASFLCRVGEGALLGWGWLGCAAAVAQRMHAHVNPGIGPQMLVAVLILAVGARQLAVLLAPLLPLRQGARRMAAQIAALLQVCGVRRATADRLLARLGPPALERRPSMDTGLGSIGFAESTPTAASPVRAEEETGGSIGAATAGKKKRRKKSRRSDAGTSGSGWVGEAIQAESFVVSADYSADMLRLQPMPVSTSMLRAHVDCGLAAVTRLSRISAEARTAAFERTVRVACRDAAAAGRLVVALAADGGAWGASFPRTRLQRDPDGAVLLCMLSGVTRDTGCDAVGCISLTFHILSGPCVAADEARYSEIFDTTPSMPVVFIKNYRSVHSVSPGLLVLSDVEWLTRQLVTSVVERHFELWGGAGPRVIGGGPADSAPPVSCFEQIELRAALDVARLAATLSGNTGPEGVASACQRLEIAADYFRSSPVDRTRFLYRVFEAFGNEMTVDLNDFPDVDVLSGVHVHLSREPGPAAGLALTLSMPALVCDFHRASGREQPSMAAAFAPRQSAQVTAAGVFLAAYLGKLISICSSPDGRAEPTIGHH